MSLPRPDVLSNLGPVHAAQLTLYGEARNQPVLGMVAVLAVLANRLSQRRKSWGSTWTQVCLASWQFSCWNPSDPNYPVLLKLASLLTAGTRTPYDPAFDICGYLADRAVYHELDDNTKGATHYFNPAVVAAPAWASPPASRTVVIGDHAFYRGVA